MEAADKEMKKGERELEGWYREAGLLGDLEE